MSTTMESERIVRETSKTTTTKTYETTMDSSPRPASMARNLVITRTSGQSPSSSTRVEKSVRSSNVYSGSPAAGAYAAVTTAGVNSVKETRQQEKKDMQDLNDRFANYLENVRFLEAQNQKLADDLEKLKTKWGRETLQIKAMYQAELDEARKMLDDALKENAKIQIRINSIEEQTDLMSLEVTDIFEQVNLSQAKFSEQSHLLIEYETSIEALRRSIAALENDRERNRNLFAQMQEGLQKARQDLDTETLGHIDAENRRQTVEEEIEFLKRLHEEEMKEMGSLVYRETETENRDYWKSLITQAIREIEDMYEDKLGTMKVELENQYKVKVDELNVTSAQQNVESSKTKEEVGKLKNELPELKKKLDDLVNENNQLQRELDLLRRRKDEQERDYSMTNGQLQTEALTLKTQLDNLLRQIEAIINTKLSLELEIAAYRKLLEGEESRLSSKTAIDTRHLERQENEHDKHSSSRGELRAKTTFQASAKGALSFNECTPDGKCIRVENKGKKVESLSGWKIVRIVDGRNAAEFVFPDDYDELKPGKKISIWAKDKKPQHAPPTDLEMTNESWGIGAKVVTKLMSPQGEERATHVQTTVYTS